MRMAFNLQIYHLADGSSPYEEWFNGLDAVTARRIDDSVSRMAAGNFCNCKPIESSTVNGVFERTLDFGPGWRVYYGRDGATVVLLLTGGSKRTQRRDIARALSLWQDFKTRKAQNT